MNVDISLYPWYEPIAVRWSDFDMLGHVNNAVYHTYLETARIHYFEQIGPWPWEVTGMVLARMEMDFVQEITRQHQPRVHMRICRLGTKSFDMESVIVDERKPEQVLNHARAVLVAFDKQTKGTVPIPQPMREKFVAFEPVLQAQ